MKLKKHIKYKDGNQVWRILISPTGKLIIETRNPDKKEAFFSCIDLITSKKIFKTFQFPEKYWIGIEDFYNDTLLLHRFSKPDMPQHKSIIAFDLNSQKIIWENESYAFLFLYDHKVYTYLQKFEGRQFYTLHPETGELIDDLGDDQLIMNELKYKADDQKDYKEYKFPEPIDLLESPKVIKDIINDLELVGPVELVNFGDFLIFNFHSRVMSNILENKFFVYDTNKNKTVYKEILNASVVSAVPDSFFIFDKYLILLNEKREVLVYKMD